MNRAQNFLGYKKLNMRTDEAGIHRKLEIQELEEIRNKAFESSHIYKDKTKAFHDNYIPIRPLRLVKRYYFMTLVLNGFPVSYGPGGWDHSLLLTYMIMVQSRLKVTNGKSVQS